jgi:predicted Zn-dependent peptidase
MNSWHLPDITRFRLPSGLAVWLLQRDDLPVISLTLAFPEGANEDEPGLQGSAYLAGLTLDTGTATRSALDISGAMERLGSSLRVTTGHDGTTIGLTSLVRNFRPSLEILADMLAHATFPENELERKRTKHLTGIAQQKDRASTVASWAFHRLAYGASHPYGIDSGGTEESVRRIRREDTAGYHHKHLTPDSCTAIIIGPVNGPECRSLFQEILSPWNTRRQQPFNRSVPSPETRTGLFLIDRPKSSQTEIRIGHPSLRRNSPDFFPAIILNRVLGGQFSSRLNANLRERRGFTYGAWSSFGMGRLGGPFVAGAAVNTENTGAALGEMIGEIDGMSKGNLTAGELSFATEGIAGNFALMFETPAQVAGVLQNIIFYGLGEDYYATYLDSLRSVALNSVNLAARRYLSADHMTAVVVGDAGEIGPLLASQGSVTGTDLKELGL